MIVEQKQDMILAHIKYAELFMADGLFVKAKKELKEALSLDTNNWLIILEIAKCEAKCYITEYKSLFKEHYYTGAMANYRKDFHLSIIKKAVEEIKLMIEQQSMPIDEQIEIHNKLAVTMFFASFIEPEYFNQKYRFWDKSTDCKSYIDLCSDRRFAYLNSIKNIEYAISLIDNYTDELSVSNAVEMKKNICEIIANITYNSYLSGNKDLIEKCRKYRWDVRVLYPDFGFHASELADPYKWERKNFDYKARDKNIKEYWLRIDEEERIAKYSS